MSRDDSGSFRPGYAELEIVKKNPFATIDQTGVGQLMQIAIEKSLSYVSCSPYHVPVARLAAA